MFKLAVRGCLVGAIFFSVHALAQDDVKRSDVVEPSARVTADFPRPKKEAPKTAPKNKAEPVKPLPPSPVESARHAKPPCDKACQSAKNEKADLVAQESMVIAAFELVKLTRWQIWLGIAGMCILIYTLNLTRIANKAAIAAAKSADRAVQVTENASERQLRAYVHVEKIRLQFVEATEEWIIAATIKNYGQTPAKNCWVRINVLYGGDYGGVDFLPGHKIKKEHLGSIAPSAFIDTTLPVHQTDRWEQFKTGNLVIYAFGRLEYQDAWGQRRGTWFRMKKIRDLAVEFSLCPYGNRHT